MNFKTLLYNNIYQLASKQSMIYYECLTYKCETPQMCVEFEIPLNCQLLLFGSEAWNAVQNIETVETVHKFIKRTKRFSIMRSIHPIFFTSPIAFLLLLFILYCHSFRPISFLCTSILSSSRYLFRHLLLYIRYFP